MVLLKYVIFPVITPKVSKLSLENAYFASNMFILAMEWLSVNLISVGQRSVHFLWNCVKIGSHDFVHIIVKKYLNCIK